MKILLALLAALASLPTASPPAGGAQVAAGPAAQAATADEAPECTVALTLPGTAHDLELGYRQVGPDLSRFREPPLATEADLRALRVQAHLALGSSLASDVWLTIGDRRLDPGRRPLGFTLGADEAMHLFLVDGREAFPITSEPFDPGFESPRLLLQLRYVSRGEARLLWHWKKAAGSLRIGLGTSEAAAAPAPAPAEPGR